MPQLITFCINIIISLYIIQVDKFTIVKIVIKKFIILVKYAEWGKEDGILRLKL